MNFMDYALEEAVKAKDKGEVPVGCVVIKNGEIIGRGHNLKEDIKCVTGHAEIMAIQNASKNINNWRLENSEMYVTVEPCSMCMGAILQSRISKLHIGTFNKDMGACGTIVDLSDIPEFNSFLDVIWEYDDRCSKIMSDFFREKRSNS